MSLSNRLGLLGRKVGMMRIFTDDGDAVPVTVIDVSNNRVTQVKTVDTDGYTGVQVAFGTRKASRVLKPQAGHLAKAGVEAGTILKEFRVTPEIASEYKPGTVVPVGLFEVGQLVDVVELRFRYDDTVVRHAKQPVIWMTQRRRLDAKFSGDGAHVERIVAVAFEDQSRRRHDLVESRDDPTHGLGTVGARRHLQGSLIESIPDPLAFPMKRRLRTGQAVAGGFQRTNGERHVVD